jgi:hypothetical protein
MNERLELFGLVIRGFENSLGPVGREAQARTDGTSIPLARYFRSALRGLGLTHFLAARRDTGMPSRVIRFSTEQPIRASVF